MPTASGSKRALQLDPPFPVGAEDSANKSPKLDLGGAAWNGSGPAARGADHAGEGDAQTGAGSGDGQVVATDGAGRAGVPVPAVPSGEVRLREEVASACLHGWGPAWALAIHQVAHVHRAGTGVLSCGEACLAEVQKRIKTFAGAADAAAAASDLTAPVDGFGRPPDKVEVVLERMSADDGGAAGLADPMVMLLLQQHAPGDALRHTTQEGLQGFVAQCEQVCGMP